MAFCKNCGVEINEGTAFCPNCGTKQDNVNVASQPQNGVNATPQPQYTSQPQAVDNGGFGWGLLGCCIPIVGLVLFLVCCFHCFPMYMCLHFSLLPLSILFLLLVL